jgi:hypothetical protein
MSASAIRLGLTGTGEGILFVNPRGWESEDAFGYPLETNNGERS